MPKIVNLVGQTFGQLEVVAKSANKCTGGKTMYIVRCKCTPERTFEVRGTNLTSGRTNSCVCTKSIGEANIARILTDNKKTFAKEYTFTNLVSINKLRFDFAVMTDDNELAYLIEFDGIQHTEASGQGWNTEENLQSTQERDRMKNEYCKTNGIILIRIPYTERDNITIEMLTPEISQYKI